MQEKLFDIIITDRENKKKCSICPLISYPGLFFISSWDTSLEQIKLDDYLFLHPDGKPMDTEDANKPLLLLDASWKRAFQVANFPSLRTLPKRSIINFATSYPRKSYLYSMPEMGLASVEALFAAYLIQGREDMHLLDKYYWKEQFFKANREMIDYWRNIWRTK